MNEYGICDLSIIPVRGEPSDKSEMVTQLLFGESFRIVTIHRDWCKIVTDYDHYEGWIDKKQCRSIGEEFHQSLLSICIPVAFDLVHFATNEQISIPVLIGSTLPGYNGLSFNIEKERYIYNGKVVDGINASNRDEFVEKIALKYLNAPYLWGGRGPFGIDCSGFTQQVYKFLGIKLPRDAYLQGEQGELIDSLSESIKGDLAFFDDEEGKIIHTGILLDDGMIIHASGYVRIDPIDQYGIFDKKADKYSHKLRLIRRII